MKSLRSICLLAGSLLFVIVGCESPLSDTGGDVTLSGQVLSRETNQPIRDAVIRIEGSPNGHFEVSNDIGEYSFAMSVDSTVYLNVTASKEGYHSSTVQVLAVPNRDITVPVFLLSAVQEGEEDFSEPPGAPARIVLADHSAKSIGVRDGGSDEIAQIIFVVQDSSGRAINSSGALEVQFEFGARPGANEELYPRKATTDDSGQVEVNVMSGTKSGVVQVEAHASVDGRLIRSMPVSITIHGGLPHQNHFSIAPAIVNVPGWSAYGLENSVTAFVGDKYGNPVRPGTPVYFTTNGGIIQGEALTDDLGRAPARIVTAAPQPPGGLATVTAQTADEYKSSISAETVVLFSGNVAPIQISPEFLGSTFPQSFSYVVADINGNPLAAGNTITVSVKGENVSVVGDVAVTMHDTRNRGRGTTEFRFSIVPDSADASSYASAVEIKVEGPNGSASLALTGSGVLKVTEPPKEGVEWPLYGIRD